jgi:hypothetical protein
MQLTLIADECCVIAAVLWSRSLSASSSCEAGASVGGSGPALKKKQKKKRIIITGDYCHAKEKWRQSKTVTTVQL